jgi:trans-aconitate methyltransferase
MKDSISNTETREQKDRPTDELWLPTWDASYADNTGHHRVHDAAFLATTPLTPADRLLDLGCGPGDFTRIVADLVPDGEVVGLDPQPVLLADARAQAGPNQTFVEGPVQHLDRLFPEDAAFDGIYSRAAMQWVPMADHPGYLAQVHRLVRPGGWFRLEMGGAGNIRVISAAIEPISLAHGGGRAPWTFPDAGTYLDLFEDAGFAVDVGAGDYVHTVGQRRAFDRDSLIGWLRSQCYKGFEADMPAAEHEPFRAEVEARIDELRHGDGTFDQTYVRLDALVHRPV